MAFDLACWLSGIAMANWAAESERFCPGLRILIADPRRARLPNCGRWRIALIGVDLVITTYGSLLRLPSLAGVPWRWSFSMKLRRSRIRVRSRRAR